MPMNQVSLCRMHVATLVGVAAALLFCVGCESNSSSQPAASMEVVPSAHIAKTASAEASAVPAQAPSVALADLENFTTTGPLVAEQQADIAAERDGRIASIEAQIGDRVQRGQVLALLDDRALRAVCDQEKARIASLEDQVREWQAEVKSDEADLHRADAMRAGQIISEENWEHVKYKLDEAFAEVAHARDEEAAAQAEFNKANLQLEQSRIVAPFAGVVGRSSVRLAQEVKTGDVLFWITAEAPLRVLFTVPETVMAAFKVGKPLELTTADYPALRQRGRILRVSPVIDPASGSVQIVGAVVDPTPLLNPGMSMRIRLAP